MENLQLNSEDDFELFWFKQGSLVAANSSSPEEMLNSYQLKFSSMPVDKKVCFISGAVYQIIGAYSESFYNHTKRITSPFSGKKTRAEETGHLNMLGFAAHVLSNLEKFIFDSENAENNECRKEQEIKNEVNSVLCRLKNETSKTYKIINTKISDTEDCLSIITHRFRTEYLGYSPDSDSEKAENFNWDSAGSVAGRKECFKRIKQIANTPLTENERAEERKIDGNTLEIRFPYAFMFLSNHVMDKESC